MAAKETKNALLVGALATAAAAGAAGYYFYASPAAKKHRRIAVKWAADLKKDVVREAKKLKNIDRATVASVVDEAAAAYKSVRDVDARELIRAARELKTNWQELAREIPALSKAMPKAQKRAAKKSAKKRSK